MKDLNKITVFTDGGSRSNPGPAALGVVILNKDGHLIKKYGHYLGHATNNEAEYGALIFALKKIKALYGKDKIKRLEVDIKSDSELMVNQMAGRYKLVDPKIQRLFIEAWNLKID
ncbi:MAG: ribonuclease HI family protein, partial [Candidatus Parcubacteria bacterium]|nr:ribonuclease HI family protein [Candidatus Parcubacteria bacterium]